MADGVFNIAKGRVVELYNRVDTNDPSTAGLVIVALKESGLVEDSVLQDYATLEAVLAGASDEATNTGYERKTLDDTAIASIAVDNTNNRFDVDIPDITWESVQATGGAWKKLLVCYDAILGSGTDAAIIPLTYHDFVVTPDGSTITAQIATAGFFRAS